MLDDQLYTDICLEAARDMPPPDRFAPDVRPLEAAHAIVTLCEAVRAVADLGAAPSQSSVTLIGDRALHVMRVWARMARLDAAEHVSTCQSAAGGTYPVLVVSLAHGLYVQAIGDTRPSTQPAGDQADVIHRQLAAPGHKTTAAGDPLRCECGHAAADAPALHRHQILPGGGL